MVPTDSESTTVPYNTLNEQHIWQINEATRTHRRHLQSQTDKPQLARDVYVRLLDIANRTNQNHYSAKDILMAAYTGCRLTYRSAGTTTSNATAAMYRATDPVDSMQQ